MVCWLIYEASEVRRNRAYIDFYIDEGNKRGMDVRLILSDALPHRERPDFAVVRAPLPALTRSLEAQGIPVFNNSFVSEICNDKAKTYEYLHKNGIPVLPWELIRAGAPHTPCDFPVVIKPCVGHGGKNVFLVKNDSEYRDAVNAIGENDFVRQRVADTLGRDMRVYVLGKTPVAAVLRTSARDFRSNFSIGGHVEARTLTNDERALVLRVCDLFDFGLVGVDIMYDGGKPVINEIEDVVGSRMLYATHDINIVALYLDFILRQICS